jgi:propionyl-CoA carboxylase alpha chain
MDGAMVSPLPGVVRRVEVRAGDRVEAGAVLVVVEAMKTEHRVAAPHAGRVREVLVAEGEQVDAGMVLAVVDGEAASPTGAGADHDASPPAERRE